jgi:hypothetical protein
MYRLFGAMAGYTTKGMERQQLLIWAILYPFYDLFIV